jgi:hypothetical protein
MIIAEILLIYSLSTIGSLKSEKILASIAKIRQLFTVGLKMMMLIF